MIKQSLILVVQLFYIHSNTFFIILVQISKLFTHLKLIIFQISWISEF